MTYLVIFTIGFLFGIYTGAKLGSTGVDIAVEVVGALVAHAYETGKAVLTKAIEFVKSKLSK